MRLKLSPLLLVLAFCCLSSAARAQSAAALVDVIARSLPETGEGWRLVESSSAAGVDGRIEAHFRWTDGGGAEVGATVFSHRSLRAARGSFRPAGVTRKARDAEASLSGDFLIAGVGDEAYMWPPKAPGGTAYNIRLRSGRVEAWVSAGGEARARQAARHIAEAVRAARRGRR